MSILGWLHVHGEPIGLWDGDVWLQWIAVGERMALPKPLDVKAPRFVARAPSALLVWTPGSYDAQGSHYLDAEVMS